MPGLGSDEKRYIFKGTGETSVIAGREVLDDVESEIGGDDGVDGVGDGALQQRVAVVGRVRHEIGGDVAAGAAAVLDDELLAELLAERLRQHARGDVARGARTEADDDAHRPRRIALRLGDRDGEATHSALNIGSRVGIYHGVSVCKVPGSRYRDGRVGDRDEKRYIVKGTGGRRSLRRVNSLRIVP